MGEKSSVSVDGRIESCGERIERLRTEGVDVSKFMVIFDKIESANKAGNVKPENLSAAVKKLESLLDINDRLVRKDRERSDSGNGKGPEPEPGPDFGSDLEELTGLQEQVKALGGDPSPVFHHMEAIREAMAQNNARKFIGYRDVLRPWFGQYLQNLKRKRIDVEMERIKGSMTAFEEWGRLDLRTPIKEELDTLAPLLDKAGTDLDMVMADIENIKRMVSEAVEKLDNDLETRLEERTVEMRSLLLVKNANVDVRIVDETFKKSKEMASEGDRAGALKMIDTTIDRFKTVLYKEKIEQRDRYLSLLVPIIDRVGETSGKDSEVYRDLIDRKKAIEDIPIDRIDAALNDVGILLDEAARASARSEEALIREMRSRIEGITRSIGSEEGPEYRSVERIVQKADSALVEGDIPTASGFLEKAESALKRILEKKERATMEVRLKFIQDRLGSFSDSGTDTGRIMDDIAKTREALIRDPIDIVRGLLAGIEEAFTSLEAVEIRSIYQSLHVTLSGEIDKARSEGATHEDMDKAIGEAESLMGSGRTKEAVKVLSDSIEALKSRRTMEALSRNLEDLETLMTEAKGYGLDVREVEITATAARSMMDQGDIEDALGSVARAMSSLESMIRERNVKRLENEIETMANEMTRMGLPTADHKDRIAKAYALVEEDRIEAAITHLSSMKQEYERQLNLKRLSGFIETMTSRIREARLFNVDISDHKAALTKARVRQEAGDVEGALRDVRESLVSLETVLEEQRSFRSRMDAIRGSVITLQGKVQRLDSRGVDTTSLKERLDIMRSFIEAGDESRARSLGEELDREMGSLFRELPVVSLSEGKPSGMRVQIERSRSSIEMAYEKETGEEVGNLDPQEARRRLQVLLTRIGRAVQSGGPKAQAESREDLEKVKNLILKRDYIGAYRIALACMKRLSDRGPTTT